MSPILRRTKKARVKVRRKTDIRPAKTIRIAHNALHLVPQILHPNILRHILSCLPRWQLPRITRVNKAMYETAGPLLYRRIAVDMYETWSPDILQGFAVDVNRTTRSHPASPCGNLKQYLLDFTEALHFRNSGLSSAAYVLPLRPKSLWRYGLNFPRLQVLRLDVERFDAKTDHRFLSHLFPETLIADMAIFETYPNFENTRPRLLAHLQQIPNLIYVVDSSILYFRDTDDFWNCWSRDFKQHPTTRSATILFKGPFLVEPAHSARLHSAIAQFCANHTVSTSIVGVDSIQMRLDGLTKRSNQASKFVKRFQRAVEKELTRAVYGQGKNLDHVRFCTTSEYMNSAPMIIAEEIQDIAARGK